MKEKIKGLKFVISRSFIKDKIQETIEFFDSFVKYNNNKGDKIIFYKDITLIRYYKRQTIGKYKGITFYIGIADNKKNNIIVYQYQEFFNETFSKILFIINKIIKPYLIANLLKQLKADGKIEIGPLILTTEGLYKKGF